MSGFYSTASASYDPPHVGFAVLLGDTVSGLYAAIGIMAALRSRDVTGVGQHLDIAMLDCMLGIQDFGLSSAGRCARGQHLGWHCARVPRRGRLVRAERQPASSIRKAGACHRASRWASDASLNSAQDWVDRMDDVIRPGIEAWSADRTRSQVCDVLTEAGLAAGPLLTFEEPQPRSSPGPAEDAGRLGNQYQKKPARSCSLGTRSSCGSNHACRRRPRHRSAVTVRACWRSWGSPRRRSMPRGCWALSRDLVRAARSAVGHPAAMAPRVFNRWPGSRRGPSGTGRRLRR